jgi:hypothetical protein
MHLDVLRHTWPRVALGNDPFHELNRIRLSSRKGCFVMRLLAEQSLPKYLW